MRMRIRWWENALLASGIVAALIVTLTTPVLVKGGPPVYAVLLDLLWWVHRR